MWKKRQIRLPKWSGKLLQARNVVGPGRVHADALEPKAKVARTSEIQIERVKASPSEPRAKGVQRSIAQAAKASHLKSSQRL
jgi:hypothetical protein